MKRFLSIAILFILAISAFSQHYKIDVQINGLSNERLLLGYHMGENKYVKDTIMLDVQGKGTFQSDTLLDGGIYLVITPAMQYFEILIDNDQQFSLKTDTTDLLNNLSFEGSELNSEFLEYQKFMQEINKEMTALQTQLQQNPDNQEVKSQIETVNDKVKNYWNAIIAKKPDSFLSAIVKSIMPIEVPEFNIPESAPNKDSLKWVKSYQYNKNHYFDNMNLSDPRMLRTPILKGKLDTYFKRMIVQLPDSLIKETTRVIELSRGNERTFQYVTGTLFNMFLQSNIMGMDAVYISIAEKYYLSGLATWASEDFLKELRENVLKSKHNLIGMQAKDLVMENERGEIVTLSALPAEYTILIFWEPNCGHCKKTIPKLYEVYEKYRDYNVDVMAIYTQYEKQEWIEYLNEHPMDWHNVWDFNYQSNFRNNYNIYSTPTIYMLDADKKILAKRIDVETVEKILKDKLGINDEE